MRSRWLALIILFPVLALLPSALKAQQSEASATLLGWEQRVRNYMLDRMHNVGGTHFNRGLFREHLNSMSAEHELDLLTYRYTLFDDYDWKQAKNAYRLSMGSLNATNFAMENRVKADIILNPNNEILVNGFHSENLRANRFLFYLGYIHSFGKNHHVGFKHTFTREKSDLDATFFYRYGNFDEGMIEVDFTMMDWAGNVVQKLAAESRGKYNKRYKITHQYGNMPELLSIKLISPQSNHFKAEIIAGLQTYSRKRVEKHADTLHFVDEEWAHYIGALLQYSNQDFTVGMTYQRTFSKLRRIPDLTSNFSLDFTNMQNLNSIGLFGATRINSFRLEQWMWYEYNIDRLQGEKVPGDLPTRRFERVPFNYIEKRVKLKSRLLYDPKISGFKAGLEYHADFIFPQGEKAENGVRNLKFRTVYSIIKDRNTRLTLTIGYRFSENFFLIGGVSYDLDKDKISGRGVPKISGTPTWFDGGFGRLAISW
ncbi:MAG TPA: hypothetical protein VF181_07210 [Balneolaceae bacterium]